jgi:hypothetical protein
MVATDGTVWWCWVGCQAMVFRRPGRRVPACRGARGSGRRSRRGWRSGWCAGVATAARTRPLPPLGSGQRTCSPTSPRRRSSGRPRLVGGARDGVMTRWAFDMPERCRSGVSYVLRHESVSDGLYTEVCDETEVTDVNRRFGEENRNVNADDLTIVTGPGHRRALAGGGGDLGPGAGVGR